VRALPMACPCGFHKPSRTPRRRCISLNVSPVSPRVVWGVGPFLARDALGRKWATQLAGSYANDVLTALQCGGGPDYGCALSHK
jgi:hypothetical protein